jgi:hypothetical protein
MSYLDVTPMIAALRTRPEDFDVNQGRLRHLPSGHRVIFDPLVGDARIDAHCECSSLSISRHQSRELRAAFEQWTSSYWRVVRINREFEAHFGHSLWRRLCVRLLRYVLEGRRLPTASISEFRRSPV